MGKRTIRIKNKKKILIANEGEIAVRIMRSCREMGIETVAVYSDADRSSLHVRYATRLYHIGPSPLQKVTFRMDKILDVALKSGADAIHPRLRISFRKNSDFARKCKEAGIKFNGPLGPSPSKRWAIRWRRSNDLLQVYRLYRTTGSKTARDEEAIRIIRGIGLPVMIKALAVAQAKECDWSGKRKISNHLFGAPNQRQYAAFGDDALYIEKYIESPHHIEFQVLADQYGDAVHLSLSGSAPVQRRHQKVHRRDPLLPS